MTFEQANVLIVTNVDRFGGTRTYLENLLKYYYKHNAKVCLYANKTADSGKLSNIIKCTKSELHIIGDSNRLTTWIYQTFPILKAIIDYIFISKIVRKNQPSLLVVTPYEPTSFFLSILLKVKKILVVHSYPNSGLSIFFKLFTIFTNTNYQLITVSKASLEIIRRHWPSSITRNSGYIYNPPQLVSLSNQQRNTILTMGHIEWYKNPFTWLNAVEISLQHTDHSILFEWRGDGKLKKNLKSEILMRGMSERVKVLPPTSKIGSLYSRCLVYFQPSIVESQGIAVCTAQSVGIPCVVSQVGGLPEMILNNRLGYLADPNDSVGLAQMLINLINKHSQHSNSKFRKSKNTFQAWYSEMNALHVKLSRQ